MGERSCPDGRLLGTRCSAAFSGICCTLGCTRTTPSGGGQGQTFRPCSCHSSPPTDLGARPCQALSDPVLFVSEVACPGFTILAPRSSETAESLRGFYGYSPASHRDAFSKGRGPANKKILSKNTNNKTLAFIAWVESGLAERSGFWAATKKSGVRTKIRKRCSLHPLLPLPLPPRRCWAWGVRGGMCPSAACPLGTRNVEVACVPRGPA